MSTRYVYQSFNGAGMSIRYVYQSFNGAGTSISVDCQYCTKTHMSETLNCALTVVTNTSMLSQRIMLLRETSATQNHSIYTAQ